MAAICASGSRRHHAYNAFMKAKKSVVRLRDSQPFDLEGLSFVVGFQACSNKRDGGIWRMLGLFCRRESDNAI